MMRDKNTAIVLAGGSGRRMGGDVKKQYMTLAGHPVIYHTLRAFEDSFMDEVILVVSPGDEEYCREQIVEGSGFKKTAVIVPGGRERYHSVHAGIRAAHERGAGYIYIHDGARAFVTEDILKRCKDAVMAHGACVAAVPSKDTMKLSDEEGFVKRTLERERLWSIQTPQVFEAELIKRCYERLIEEEMMLSDRGIVITDDAMAVELYSDVRVKLVEGSYENIKLTTPEDMAIGERILAGRS